MKKKKTLYTETRPEWNFIFELFAEAPIVPDLSPVHNFL
jgi:hypothetical protein